MTNYGGIPRRLPDMTIAPPRELTVAQLCPEGEDDERVDILTLGPVDRVVVRYRFWRNRMIEFAMMQQRKVEGEWLDVVRADTAHGEVHIHVLDRHLGEVGREVLCPATSFEDVESGYDLCCDAIMDRLDENVRLWHGSRTHTI